MFAVQTHLFLNVLKGLPEENIVFIALPITLYKLVVNITY